MAKTIKEECMCAMFDFISPRYSRWLSQCSALCTEGYVNLVRKDKQHVTVNITPKGVELYADGMLDGITGLRDIITQED